ncbi:DUF1651 domain-containing protein [Synechococcus sp. HK01-R]|uniref:DUF1651 domain-containing protein n=1 Tax=Synechococcus sp. HK01-R TaxID=2751171 RepID=UPI001626FD27|nr:DUF1651 domain-containing protein [Synechococcus sp. HK01-R]QNG26173.1 DUF1651 domain-containing protein [Synechococcus sp. HK01-R]
MRHRPPNAKRHQPEPPAGSWLMHGRSRQLLHFKPVNKGSGEWIELRYLYWVPPHPPVTQNRRLISLDDALERWGQLRASGWRQVQRICHC